MFTEPKHGWTNLEIGDFSEGASYLTDIPNDCLDAFIYALENTVPISVFFDAEGWYFHLVSSYYGSYVIVDKDNTNVFTINKNYLEIAKELVNDIELYFDGWIMWDFLDEEIEEERNQINIRKNILKQKLDKLKLLIRKRELC